VNSFESPDIIIFYENSYLRQTGQKGREREEIMNANSYKSAKGRREDGIFSFNKIHRKGLIF